MIFRRAEDKDREPSTNFVEMIHANNLSEEVLEILQSTKQPLIPILYEKTFNALLQKMPDEVQKRVDVLCKEYDYDNSKITPEDIKYNFDVMVRMLQSIAEIYNKIKEVRETMHNSSVHLQDANAQAIASIGLQMDRDLTNTVGVLTRNVGRLKKEYAVVKNYVQGIHNSSVFDKNFAIAYTHNHFVNLALEDIDYLTYEEDTGHGMCLITLNPKFRALLKQSRSKLQKSEEDIIEEMLIKKTLSIVLSQSLRKNDYIGLSAKGDFAIFIRCIAKNALENFIANFIFAIQNSRLFASKNNIEVCASGLFLKEPGSMPQDILQRLETMLVGQEASDTDAPFVVGEM